MNSYFYKIFLPYTALAMLGVVFAVLNPVLLFWTLGFWIIIGPLGSGIGFHRLFAHRQFKTYRCIELFLAFAGTISTYGPLLFWVSSHQSHHKYADTELDPTSPTRGFWHSVLTWNLKKKCENEITLKSYPCLQIMRDKILMWFSKNFFSINYAFLAILLLINPQIALAGYVLSTFIERIRIGFFVNYLLHSNVPGSYRVIETKDNSRNFTLLYPLTAGFSLHNAHHAKPMRIEEKHKWYEIDLEYWLTRIIKKHD